MNAKPLGLAAALALAGLSPAPANAAKVCKDAVAAKGTSRVQLSDASREARARDNAIANWGKRARDSYGYAYKFWWRAEEKQVECGGSASAKRCTVTAKPCRLY